MYAIRSYYVSGRQCNLSEFEGKVLLIVNTASKCGFTPQYAQLQALHEKYHSSGLEIIGFPCNQFGRQEPGSKDQISKFCRINYGVTFRLSQKIYVNGKKTHPLFVYLKSSLKGIFGNSIKWNFTKFLVDKHGIPVQRLGSYTSPDKLIP